MPGLQQTSNDQGLPAIIYKPSELLGMFTAYLSRQEVNSKVIFLRGIYLKNPRHDPHWTYRYDILRDEDTQTEITLQMSQKQSDELKDGNLVTVGGILGRRVQKNSHIQLLLVVSRIEIVKDQVIDEDELKRFELRRKKVALGYKNVDGLLEQKLFTDERPKVALVFATTSITMADFNAGINAARSAIDFQEYRVNFSSPVAFTTLLKQLDTQGFDVIALVRGGGAQVEAADDLGVLEVVANLKTPVIAAIGHVEEKLFIKQIVDKEAPTPNGLGQYFSDMVESVSEKKNKSRAALTEKIKKQFKEQIEAGQKQNKELQEKLTKLTKAEEEIAKKHNEQLKSIQKQHKDQLEKTNKQNEELQKKLTEITKSNETAQKAHSEQLGKLQAQLKQQAESSSKQSKEFSENLKKMQDTNGELSKSLQKLTAQNNKANKELNESKEHARQLEQKLAENKSGNNVWIIIAIITAIVGFVLGLLL